MQPTRRPNILLLLADDWGWPTAEAKDTLDLKAPTFDRICREGTQFTNAHVAAPSCTASRAAMLTGRPPYQLEQGAWLSGTLPAKFAVYPDLVEAAGYHTGFCGKGWGPGNVAAGGRTRNPAGNAFKSFADFLGKRPQGAPFCFWFGSTDPHRPFERGAGEAEGIRIPAGRLPSYLPDNPVVRSDVADYVSRVERFDREAGAVVAALEASGELDNTLIVIAGDNGWAFPHAKATLYEGGTHVPLAIRWPAQVAKGRISDRLVLLTDLCPTFLKAAGVPCPPAVTGASLVDLAMRPGRNSDAIVTCLERHMDGREVSGQAYPARALRKGKWLYIRNLFPEREPVGKPELYDPTRLATFVYAGYPDIDAGPTKEYIILHRDDPGMRRYFDAAVGKRPAQELYDVHADPANMVNLAGEESHQTLLKAMDDQLMAELRRSGDPRVLGTGAFLDTMPDYAAHKGEQGAERFTRPVDY